MSLDSLNKAVSQFEHNTKLTKMATEKQIGYAMYLLDKNGYSTKYMDKDFAKLGATMRERSGTVESWLSEKSNSELSSIIRQLMQ